jgi:putative methyltransferase (TIGR04325 family)
LRYRDCGKEAWVPPFGSRLWQALIEEAARVPVVRAALNRSYKREFDVMRGSARIFYGLYQSFPEAIRDISPGSPEGHDSEVVALRLAGEAQVRPSDYPILFWLHELLPDCRLLFDLGGGVGISYFAYRRLLRFPPGMTWLIDELPSVAALGARLASRESDPELRYTSSIDELAHADILLASGSLHLIEDPFDLLRSAAALPPHFLINKVPLVDRPSAVTLHNLGPAFCAYHLFNRAQFVDEIRSLGYELQDEWATPDLSERIPYFPEYRLTAYTGFYFRKAR